jgi:hypothetical protein
MTMVAATETTMPVGETTTPVVAPTAMRARGEQTRIRDREIMKPARELVEQWTVMAAPIGVTAKLRRSPATPSHHSHRLPAARVAAIRVEIPAAAIRAVTEIAIETVTGTEVVTATGIVIPMIAIGFPPTTTRFHIRPATTRTTTTA